MIERWLQPVLPEMSKQEMLEGMGKDELVDHILALGARVTEIETDMNLASDVLEGAYGTTVASVLIEREKPNGAA